METKGIPSVGECPYFDTTSSFSWMEVMYGRGSTASGGCRASRGSELDLCQFSLAITTWLLLGHILHFASCGLVVELQPLNC